MANQRMAGGNDFQQKMKQAANGPGGQSHKTSAPSLIGADAWDRQVGRESAQFNNAAVSGSRGAENIAAYANVSKSATAANGNFSINQGNKWVNSSRDQSNVNKEQNKGFSQERINNNVQYANKQQDYNLQKNEGFAMKTTNAFINNAKDHREDNTAKATAFADRTVDKYIAKNKGTNAINVQALDQQVRQAPLYDNAKSEVQGLYTYGDRYRNRLENLPSWGQSLAPSRPERPDFAGMYETVTDTIDSYKV